MKRPAHRPSIYTEKLAAEICNRIARGESLRSICKDENMPDRASVHRWLIDKNKREFYDQYESACNIRAENMFDALTEIADNTEGEVQRDRLRVDTRKWYLSKIMPKKFGEKMDVTSDGKAIVVTIPKEINDKYNPDTSTGTDS
jgi:hypothetical protein